MEFIKNKSKCITWDDENFDDVYVGDLKIRKDGDGYYRFYPNGKGGLSARDCKDLLKKLRGLNREIA